MRFLKGILICITILSHVCYADNAICEFQKCLAVVDVGSSGSRLHIFTEHDGRIDEVWKHKVGPGFSTIEPSSDAINKYLTQLFDGSPQEIPVYFYATAGMRLLSIERQEKYYQIVRDWFETRPFELLEAKTITGVDEGIYAWVATYTHLLEQGIEPPEYLSVMDMGGASVQIVSKIDYPTFELDKSDASDLIKININQKQQVLFVHSFLGLGQQLITQQLLDQPSCFPIFYTMPDGSTGQGNAFQCADKATTLINGLHEVDLRVKSVIHQDEAQRTWYVLGGLSYMATSEPFKRNDQPIHTAWLIKQAQDEFCNQNWSDVVSKYGQNHGFSRNCLIASSYYALITNGYGIRSEEPILIAPEASDLDWTLGVAAKNSELMIASW